MHAGRRADFFCGVYQLETRFARIILIQVLLSPPHSVSPSPYWLFMCSETRKNRSMRGTYIGAAGPAQKRIRKIRKFESRQPKKMDEVS